MFPSSLDVWFTIITEDKKQTKLLQTAKDKPLKAQADVITPADLIPWQLDLPQWAFLFLFTAGVWGFVLSAPVPPPNANHHILYPIFFFISYMWMHRFSSILLACNCEIFKWWRDLSMVYVGHYALSELDTVQGVGMSCKVRLHSFD